MDTREEQPLPVGQGPEIWPRVLDAIGLRIQTGRQRYRTTLRAFNSRDVARDCIEEAIDLLFYLTPWQLERQALVDACVRLLYALEQAPLAAEVEAAHDDLLGLIHSMGE